MVTRKIYYLIIVLLFLGCGKSQNVDCENPDYSNCNTVEPTEGTMHIIVTKLEKTSRVPLVLYQGKFGAPEKTIFNDTVYSVDTSFILPLNLNYYAVAKYLRDGKTINAVDGAYFKKVSKDVCDSVCWSVKGSEIDVRLK